MKLKSDASAKEKDAVKVCLSPGRPRAFDAEAALDKALHLFWEKGYEGTSLADLTSAMGINRPSLYAAFGNKEALFQKALDRYAEQTEPMMSDVLSQPTARAVVETLLNQAANAQCGEAPRGCLLVKSALACSDASVTIQQELNKRRALSEAELCRRFKRAKREGDLPPETNCADLARYITTVLHGLTVQAVGGASSRELRRVVALALKNWPE